MSEQRPQLARPSRAAALLFWLIAAAGLLFGGTIVGLIVAMLGIESEQLRILISNLFYYLPFVGLPLWRYLRRRPECAPALRPNPISPSAALLIALLAVVGMLFVNDLILLWAIPLQELGVNMNQPPMPLPAGRGELMLQIISIAAIPAIFEELLFRGALLSAFERRGARRAAIYSSILFALLHGTLPGLPAQFVLGLVMAWVVIYCDSIYAGLIYHTVHNAAILIVQCMQDSGGASEFAPRYLDAIGGLPGLVGVLINAAIMGWLMRLILRALRARAHARGVIFASDQREPLKRRERVLIALVAVMALLLYLLTYLSLPPQP